MTRKARKGKARKAPPSFLDFRKAASSYLDGTANKRMVTFLEENEGTLDKGWIRKLIPVCGKRSKNVVDENEAKAMLIVLLATKEYQGKTESRVRTEELVEYAFGLVFKIIRKHAKTCCFHSIFVLPSDEDPPSLDQEANDPPTVATPTDISAGRRKRSARTPGPPRLSTISKPSKAARLGPTPGRSSETDETALSLFDSSNETLNTKELFTNEKDWRELAIESDTSLDLVVQEDQANVSYTSFEGVTASLLHQQGGEPPTSPEELSDATQRPTLARRMLNSAKKLFTPRRGGVYDGTTTQILFDLNDEQQSPSTGMGRMI
jgi:hypothetical protein